MDNNSFSFKNTGTSSLLIIFVIICLVVFAVLSLSTAKSDKNFSQSIADRQTSYYDANNSAEEILDDIDTILADSAKECGLLSGSKKMTAAQTADYRQTIQAKLADYRNATITMDTSQEDSIGRLSYTIPMEDARELTVVLVINNPKDNQHFYTINSWNSVNTSDWEGDDSLTVLK